MPYSLATRWSTKATSVQLLGGETFTAVNRQTEMLRKISQQTRRLRGRHAPNTNFDATTKGRQDSIQALVKRGILPIHVMDGAVTLHAWVQGYPAIRLGNETVTVTDGTYTKAFALGSNADDATLAATGVRDFTATDSADPQSSPGQPAPTPTVTGAMGAARATIT